MALSLRTSLPVETLHEIALYLPRYILKSLFIFQPHPLGKTASYVYFSELSLYLGNFGLPRQYMGYEPQGNNDKLAMWHNQRSRNILTTIVESDFGNRIQKLRIYAAYSGSGNHTDVLESQISKSVCFLSIQFPPHYSGL
jgi:hypothetical protein